MRDKDLYHRKMQAKLDEWVAEVDKVKAMASGASADAQLHMNKHIRELEKNIEEGKLKMLEFAKAGEEVWDALKDGMESAWDSLMSAVSDTASKFRD